jgi:sodium transport system ATP-binding protein
VSDPQAHDPMVQVEGLTRRFGDKYAVKDLSFKVAEGEIFGLLGPNGAGKTTTIRMLSTVITPHAGTARIDGFDVHDDTREVRARLGVLTAQIGLYERFTVRENIEYFARLYGMPEEAIGPRVDFLLDLLEARDFQGQRAAGLSTGMRQKVAIARCVVHDPPVLIFDEPTLGLDVLASQAVREFMIESQRRGVTVILSTHDMYVAQKMCNRLAVMHEGRMVAYGSPRGIMGETGTDSLEAAFISLLDEKGGERR